MLRVKTKDPRDYPFFLRPFFWSQKRKYGKILDSALLWARSPKLFSGVAVLYGMIDRRTSPIDPALRSLVTVRVSQLNGCRFCIDLNSATLMKRGVSEEQVLALHRWQDSPLFSRRERTVLAYTEFVTEAPDTVPETVYEELRQFFDEDGLVELTGLIAFQNMSAKFNTALGVAPQGFCRIPTDAIQGSHILPHAAE